MVTATGPLSARLLPETRSAARKVGRSESRWDSQTKHVCSQLFSSSGWNPTGRELQLWGWRGCPAGTRVCSGALVLENPHLPVTSLVLDSL